MIHSSGSLPLYTVESKSDSARFKSPLRYPGGKQKAVAQISSMLPSSKVKEYREPMVGGGSLFFHARRHNLADSYWINDLFFELYAFWKSVQNEEACLRLCRDLERLRRSFRNVEQIKEYFLAMREFKPRSEFEAAMLFFFFNRVTFSGTTRAGGFSSAAATARFTASSIERLAPMPAALQAVKITNLDVEAVIAAPGKDVFIFLDPPYYQAQRLYGSKGELHEFDHDRLAHALKKTKHRFLITYDDCKEIRKLYSFAEISPWQLQYGMNNCNLANTSKVGTELFIRNYG
jgi:DNA adenine methylase